MNELINIQVALFRNKQTNKQKGFHLGKQGREQKIGNVSV